jgi:hypothetical protein
MQNYDTLASMAPPKNPQIVVCFYPQLLKNHKIIKHIGIAKIAKHCRKTTELGYLLFRPYMISPLYDFAPLLFRTTIISPLYDFAPI